MYKEKYYFWLIAVITTTGKWQQTSSDAHHTKILNIIQTNICIKNNQNLIALILELVIRRAARETASALAYSRSQQTTIHLNQINYFQNMSSE